MSGPMEACQKLSPMRTCSGSFAARIVVRLRFCNAPRMQCGFSMYVPVETVRATEA